MNPASFNTRPIIIPMNPNPNFAYFYQMPIPSINLQFPSMLNWPSLPSVPLQYDLRHPLYRQLMLQQALKLNSKPLLSAQHEIEATFEGKHLYFEQGLTTKTESGEHECSDEELLKKEEYSIKKEEYSIEDSSPEEILKPKVEAKAEFKLEEESVMINKRKSQNKKQGFGKGKGKKKTYTEEEDDEDDDDEKQEAWDDDRTSEGPESLMTGSDGNPMANLRNQLREMVEFIIAHFGRIREIDLVQERMKYEQNPVLSQVFEVLNSKYSCTFKTRAEIVKYITRKAFSTIKNNSKKESDATSKEACKVLCKRYFQVSSEEIQNSGVDIENRERFLQLLFPYQKNSKNKLQDMELISKLMSSKEFYEDYCLYVQDLETILEADNNRKLSKFITFILTCISKGQVQNIMKYKRVPWLKAWLDNTKIVARELAFNIQWKSQQKPEKMIKREKNCHNKEINQHCQGQETNGVAGVNHVQWLLNH